MKTELSEEAILEGIEIAKNKANPFYCTLFKRKNNKALKTFLVDNDKEEEAILLCILAGSMGELDNDTFENIKDFVTDKGELNKKSLEIKKQFNKYFRVLISNK